MAAKRAPSNGTKSAAPGRDPTTGRFVKGNTGGGRKRLPEDLKESFRAAGPEALQTLLEVMRNREARDADRIRAAEIILDRGYGKPVQVQQLETEGAGGVIVLADVLAPETQTGGVIT